MIEPWLEESEQKREKWRMKSGVCVAQSTVDMVSSGFISVKALSTSLKGYFILSLGSLAKWIDSKTGYIVPSTLYD